MRVNSKGTFLPQLRAPPCPFRTLELAASRLSLSGRVRSSRISRTCASAPWT